MGPVAIAGQARRTWVALVLLVPLASCADPTFPFDDAACRAALDAPDAMDAFDWLKLPAGGEKHLGHWSTDEGLAFAHGVQARGATAVTAVGITKTAGPPPSESAAGLVATLPDEIPARRRLFEMHQKQIGASGFSARPDEGQRYLMFRWGP